MATNWTKISEMIHDICTSYEYSSTTFNTAINIFAYHVQHVKRLLAHEWIIVAASAIHIASCVCETTVHRYKEYVEVSGYLFKPVAMREMVRNVMTVSYSAAYPCFSETDWEKAMPIFKKVTGLKYPKRLIRTKKIGEGAHGVVYGTSNKKIVIKRIIGNNDREMHNVPIREIVFMSQMNRNKRTPKLLGFEFLVNGDVELYMSNEGTDLQKTIREHVVDMSTARLHIFQILDTLRIMHQLKIAHRDIKPANVLLKNDGVDATLCDWGACRLLDNVADDHDLTHYIVTRWYRAPEIMLFQKNYTTIVDMWSMGLLMVEYSGVTLFPGKSVIDQVRLIFELFGTPDSDSSLRKLKGWNKWMEDDRPVRWEDSNEYCNIKEYWGERGIDLITRMLCTDPEKRITATQAMSHDFFKI